MKTATMWAVETEGDVEVICAIQRDAFAAGAEKMREKIATHYGGEERLYPDEVRAVDLPPFPEDQP